MYFITYFIVLAGLMILICSALLLIILLFNIPSLRDWPALSTLGVLIILYCPSSILFSTCLSYIFDKMDSAQSILPNIATFFGCIPFFLVVILDMFRIGKFPCYNIPLVLKYETITGGKAAFILHVIFSILNTMYIPYAIIYYVQRVYLMCKVNSACTTLTLADYVTEETIVMLVGILFHIPIFSIVLMVFDVKKNGGRIKDVFGSFLVRNL